jgi:uncharacterized membrane protein required for colicin V production
MTLLDAILIVIMLSFILSGVRFGFVHALGSVFGAIIGAYVATHHSNEIAVWIAAHTHIDIREFGKWITFIFIFFVTGRLFGILFWFFEKTVGVLVHLPVIHSINSLLGGFLGFCEGIIIIGLSLYYAKYLPVPQFVAAIKTATLVPWFLKTSQILLPLIPEAVRNVMYGKF